MLSTNDLKFPFILLEEAQTAFLVIHLGGKVIYANPATELLLLQSTQRLYTQTLSQLAHQFHFDKRYIEKVFKTQNSFTQSDVSLLIEGKSLFLNLSVSPLSFNSQAHVLIEMQGISQQRKSRQVYYQQHQQQIAQDLMRSLAHEIKNPLGGLRGAAQLLEAELANADLKEFTQIIIQQADRLNALVDRLLGPTKIGTRKLDNIHVALEKMRKLVQLDLPENIRIRVDYDPSIPDFEMQSDQLQQAFLNIVQNAVQALCSANTPDAQITIRTRSAHQITINGRPQRLVAEIKIIDNGPGISKHLQDTLFFPMVTGKKKGTGLGLSIAQTLIKQHHGRIEYQSCSTQTEFLIYLPIIL
ncbi:nitrogen regulation protein NR(II) [Psychromonas sp. CD1]|uniref:nitrogen regulation protein NR(II) n=1 Tax=Psychromonas sp. CD1 TaxID=1979839 RepID=UPI000B9C3DF9|nr:nitrogen regulation protein NR(II) [Psychromonas sp. CD1]